MRCRVEHVSEVTIFYGEFFNVGVVWGHTTETSDMFNSYINILMTLTLPCLYSLTWVDELENIEGQIVTNPPECAEFKDDDE